jgi:hypothetical protein
LKFLATASGFKFKKKIETPIESKTEARDEGSDVFFVEDVDGLTESKEHKEKRKFSSIANTFAITPEKQVKPEKKEEKKAGPSCLDSLDNYYNNLISIKGRQEYI